MDQDAFIAGFGSNLVKSAWLTEWVRNNVFQPVAQGTIDQHYRGLGTYRPQTGAIEVNTRNALRAITDQPSSPQAPDGLVKNTLYQIGRTSFGKRMVNTFGASDKQINNQLTSRSNGVFSIGSNGVDVDRTKLPQLMARKARQWMASHGDLVKGVGLGAAAVGLGALAFRGAREKKPQVAAPAGQAAAPFTSPPGTRGNYFTKYEEQV